MLILATAILLGSQKFPWPVATADNAYSKYLAAARILQAPYWKSFRSGPPEKKKLAKLREEAARAGPIYDLLKAGNQMPIYEVRKEQNLWTLYSEYAPLRRVSSVAGDVAYVKAMDGDLESASQWLVQADRFAFRFPTTTEIGLLVRKAMLVRLRLVTRELLPRFGTNQLRNQLLELQTISSHPADVVATMENERQILHRSIQRIVADPTLLGTSDDVPDVLSSFANSRQLIALLPQLKAVLSKIDSGAPPSTQKDPQVLLKYLTDSEAQVPTDQRDAYRKFLDIYRGILKPSFISASAFAERMTPEEKTHAEQIVQIYCDPDPNDSVEAFRRPERYWWIEIRPRSQGDANEQVMKDGREGRFTAVDLYAFRIADTLKKLGVGGTPTDLCRTMLLDREKARLAVIDAKIWTYRLVHHRLPTSLKAIGNPIDPLSGRPYHYRRKSTNTYELAAVGIPGIARIDADTKVVDINP